MEKPLVGDLRRLCDLLLVGNGAALLAIFNAKISNADAPANLRDMGWTFAAGLIAAFLMAYLIYKHEFIAGIDLGITETRSQRAQEQARRSQSMGVCFVVSAGCFVLGLVAAINLLQPMSPAS